MPKGSNIDTSTVGTHSFTVTGTHTYAATGEYSVTVTVVDSSNLLRFAVVSSHVEVREVHRVDHSAFPSPPPNRPPDPPEPPPVTARPPVPAH